MTSNRYSNLLALALVCTMLVAAVAPAAAVSVSEAEVPEEGEVGEQIAAEFTITDLYQDPNWEEWSLMGETDLVNVTWTITFIDPSGATIDVRSYDGQEFSQPDISADSAIGTITEVRVSVTGEVPDIEMYTYPDEEEFTIATLIQTRGEAGSQNEIGTWSVHHYSTGDELENVPGSQQARLALDGADAAVDEAVTAGADTSEAQNTLTNAIEAYESGQFQLAMNLAEDAESIAVESKEQVEQSEQRNQLLMFGGGGLLLVLLVAGGFWYYRQQQDDFDKLG